VIAHRTAHRIVIAAGLFAAAFSVPAASSRADGGDIVFARAQDAG
jgi:hypothetical protein